MQFTTKMWRVRYLVPVYLGIFINSDQCHENLFFKTAEYTKMHTEMNIIQIINGYECNGTDIFMR